MRGVSHGIQPSPPCLTILSSVKRDHGRPGDLCPGPALGTPVVPLPSSPGQSQGPGGSFARHQKPCSMAGAAQACWCRALLWLSLSPRVSHAHHPLQRFLLQSMSRERRPRAEQTPWGSLHFPRLQGAERGSEGAGGAGLVSHFMPIWLPALFPARFPRQLRFGTFTSLLNLRASLHPLRRISAGADCSLRGLGRVWAGCSPRDHPGTAGGVPPISGHRGGCRGPGGAVRAQGERSGPDPPAPRPARPTGAGAHLHTRPPYLHNSDSNLHRHAPSLSLFGGHRPIPLSHWLPPGWRHAPLYKACTGGLPRRAPSAAGGTGLPPP